MYTNILSYKQSIQQNTYSITSKYQLYSLIDSLQSTESITQQFVEACCHYFVTNETGELPSLIHQFVEETIVGSKDKHVLYSSFGDSISFIQQLLFTSSFHSEVESKVESEMHSDLQNEKNELLTLLKFYVSTGYFDEELVSNDMFIQNLFGLLSDSQLFIKTSVLLEHILERRQQTIDLSSIVSVKDIMKSMSYLQLGIFLPVMNHLIHNQNDQLYIQQNCRVLRECNLFERVLKLLALSSNHLIILHLLQNEMVTQSEGIIHQFQMRYVNEIESYPEVDIDFSGVHGLYCIDISANILFILSTFISSLSSTDDKVDMLKYTSLCEALSNLYLCLDIEDNTHFISTTSTATRTLYQSLFYQYIHLLSCIPSTILLNTADGLDLVELLLLDLEDNDIHQTVKYQFIGVLESIVRESTVEEKETLGSDKNLIHILLHFLEFHFERNEQNENSQQNETVSLHLVYDLLGSLIRRSSRNMTELFTQLHCSFHEFIQTCHDNCITTSVFFRSLLLNILYDDIVGVTNTLDNTLDNCLNNSLDIKEVMKEEAIIFCFNLLNELSHQGITSHTTCCINTLMVILGIFSSLSLQSQLLQHLQQSQHYMETLQSLLSFFITKYSLDTHLNDLCSITQTSSSLWISSMNFFV